MKENQVKNMRSGIEARLARLLLAALQQSAPATTPTAKLDLAYLAGEDQDRLNSLLE